MLHVFSALTQYVVVNIGLIEGDEPETTYPTPQALEYQFQFPPTPKEPPVIPRVVELPEHIVEGSPLAEVEAELIV